MSFNETVERILELGDEDYTGLYCLIHIVNAARPLDPAHLEAGAVLDASIAKAQRITRDLVSRGWIELFNDRRDLYLGNRTGGAPNGPVVEKLSDDEAKRVLAAREPWIPPTEFDGPVYCYACTESGSNMYWDSIA